jgi:multiple sugar transport system substrate-binding protein
MSAWKKPISRREFLKAGSMVVGAAALAACAPPVVQQPAATSAPAVTSAPAAAGPKYAGTKITVATLDGELSGGVEAQMEGLKAATGIEIEISKMPQTEFRQKIAADLASGAGVYDVLIEPYVFLHDHIAAGQIIPLDDFIAQDPNFHAEDFIQSIYTTYGLYDGKQYTIPYKPDTHIFYYRKDLLEDPDLQAAFKAQTGNDLKPPTTHDEHVAIARFFTKKLNPDSPTDYGFGFWGDPIGAFWLWGVMLGSFGGDFFDSDGYPTLDTEAGQKAMDVCLQLLECSPEDVGQYEWDKLNTAWISGKLATALNWPGMAIFSETPENATIGKSVVVGKVGYDVPPGAIVDGKLVQVSIMGGWTAAISKYAENPDACFAALAWMTGPEGEPLKIAAGNAPARTSTYDKIPITGTNVHLPAMLKCIEAAKINADIDYPPVSAELHNVLQVACNKVWTGQITGQEALAEMQEKCEKILKDAELIA